MSTARRKSGIVAQVVTWPDTGHIADGRGEMCRREITLDAPPVGPIGLPAERIMHEWARRTKRYFIGRSFHTATA